MNQMAQLGCDIVPKGPATRPKTTIQMPGLYLLAVLQILVVAD